MEPAIPGADIGAVLNVLQGGGNAALVLACFFIYRAERRLSRIEKALDVFLNTVGNVPTIAQNMRERLRSLRDGTAPE